MTHKITMTTAVLLLLSLLAMAAQTPNFTGSWAMDRARSFGMPGNMHQTMTVTQTGDQIDVETKLIQPDNERTMKDSYVLDGKEREFTPQVLRTHRPMRHRRRANVRRNGFPTVKELRSMKLPQARLPKDLSTISSLASGPCPMMVS
jgi:hypothetical protein